MPRFDIGPAAPLQSRDGSLSKGGQIRNGFLEKDQDGKVWSWQRPALDTGVAAPFTGNGLGLYLVGTVLWGAYSTGGTSGGVAYRVGYATNTNTATTAITIALKSNATFFTVSYNATGTAYAPSTLAPNTWRGQVVTDIHYSYQTLTSGTSVTAPHAHVTAAGMIAKNFYRYLHLNGVTWGFSTSSYGVSSGNTDWVWWGTPPALPEGTYTGGFT